MAVDLNPIPKHMGPSCLLLVVPDLFCFVFLKMDLDHLVLSFEFVGEILGLVW